MNYVEQLATFACGNQIVVGVRGAGLVWGGYLLGSEKFNTRGGWIEWDLPGFREGVKRDNIGPVLKNPRVLGKVRKLQDGDLEKPTEGKYAKECLGKPGTKCHTVFHNVRLNSERLKQFGVDLDAVTKFIIDDAKEGKKPDGYVSWG